MKRTVAIIVAVVLVGLIVFRLMGNHKKINAKQNISTDLSYTSVDVAEVKKMQIEQNLDLVGYLDPAKEVVISAEAQGSITSLNIELGQAVSQGSTIALIDSRQKLLSLKQTQISVKKLAKDLARYKSLLQGGSATEQQVDETQNAYDNAVIQEQLAAKQLSDATVKSPIGGIISKKLVERGTYINVGNPIATVVDIATMKIKLNVSEANVYLLKMGQQATITTDVYPTVSFSGKISFISPQGDQAHNYQVDLLTSNGGKNRLKAGTFVNAHFDLPARPNTLYIPREALQGSIKDAKVFVAENGKAVLKNITVRSGNDKFVEVIAGLNEGEKVVVTGQVNLTDGKVIKVNN